MKTSNWRAKTCLLGALFIQLIGCSSVPKARREATWKDYRLDSPIEQRVYEASPLVLDYLLQQNEENGFPERPHAPGDASALKADIQAAIRELPEPVKAKLSPKLIGVFLVEDLGSSGFSDFVIPRSGDPRLGMVMLDVKLLDRKANAWLTFKESSPFAPEEPYRIEGQLEETSNDSRKAAIQFLLLHEFGHILSIGTHLHPRWDKDGSQVASLRDYAFAASSWLAGERKFRLIGESAYPLHKELRYYNSLGSKAKASQSVEVYRHLKTTCFASLYATTNPFDDWAETFAVRVHSVMMHKPYRIRIFKGAEPVEAFSSPILEPRCAGKLALAHEVFDFDQGLGQ